MLAHDYLRIFEAIVIIGIFYGTIYFHNSKSIKAI